jgi:glyoxylase-like metal-dependent hydrolase (beta-lactamase superfamily II)
MRIGPYEIIALETGRFALDGGAMFGSIPKTIWNKTAPTDEQNRVELALRILLVCSSERKILVDVGAGHVFQPKWREIYRLDYSHNTLKKSLERQGIIPEQITDVILTHLHFDHAGGVAEYSDDRLQLTFSRATHYIQKSHWQWALKPSEKDRASFLRETVEPLQDGTRVKILGGGGELFPGIHLMLSNGHTPGLQMVRIQDQFRVLLFCSDLLPTASHLPLPFVMGYDLYPLTTLEEKRSILAQACEERWIIALEHDPRHEAIRIRRGEKNFEIAESMVL